MINRTNYYEVLGTEEDTPQAVDCPEEFQSTFILATHNGNKRRRNFYIAKIYFSKQSSSFNENTVPRNSTYASIAKQVKKILVIGY